MEAIESLEENMLDSAPFTLSMKDIRVDEVLVLQPEARSQNSTSESIREDKSMQERRKPGLGGCRQTGLVRSRAHGLKLSPGLPSTHTDTNHHGENGCKLKELYLSHTGSRVAGRLSWHGVCWRQAQTWRLQVSRKPSRSHCYWITGRPRGQMPSPSSGTIIWQALKGPPKRNWGFVKWSSVLWWSGVLKKIWAWYACGFWTSGLV